MAVTINGSTGITTPGITNSGNETVSGNSVVTGNFSVSGSNISPVQSFRNKIINGNFDIWQRGTSTSAGGYLADRWPTYAGGSTFTSSRQAFTLGQTDVPNEPTYFHRTVVTSVAGAANYCQLRYSIESVRTLAGQTATLSFWAKANASKDITVDIPQTFGTGGSPSSAVQNISVNRCSLTTSWQKFVITVSLPSISGKTLGTNNDDSLWIRLWFDAGSNYNSRTNSLGQQSGTFDIAQVQLEAGSVATPFEVRPPGVELALCQRYYHQTMVHMQTPVAGGYMLVPIYFPAEMRATPTATNISAGSTGGGTISGIVLSPRNTGSAYLQFTSDAVNGYIVNRIDAYSAEL